MATEEKNPKKRERECELFLKSPQSCPFQFVEGGNYFYNCKPWDSTSQADLPAGGVWTNSERSLKQFGFLRQIRDRSWKVMFAGLTRLTWPSIVWAKRQRGGKLQTHRSAISNPPGCFTGCTLLSNMESIEAKNKGDGSTVQVSAMTCSRAEKGFEVGRSRSKA